jgi:hypothetical protein
VVQKKIEMLYIAIVVAQNWNKSNKPNYDGKKDKLQKVKR